MKHKKHLELRMKSIRKAKHHSKEIGKVGSRENHKHTAVQPQGFCLPWGLTYCSSFSENPNIFNILQVEEEIVLVEPCSQFHSRNCSLCSHASMKTSKISNKKPKSQKKRPTKKPQNIFVLNGCQSLPRGWRARSLAQVAVWENYNTDILHQVSIQSEVTSLEMCFILLH